MKLIKFIAKVTPAIIIAEILFPIGPFKLFGWSWCQCFKLGIILYIYMVLFVCYDPGYLIRGDFGDDGIN